MDSRLRTSRPGIVWGIGISALLHALLIFGYRLGQPEQAPPPARSMTVWLTPPKPLTPVPPPTVAAIAAPPKPAATRPRRIADAPALRQESHETAALTPTPTPTPAPTAADSTYDPLRQDQPSQKFDMNAALKTARKVANEKDPARANLPLAQLDNHPLYPEDKETELGRKIEGATRSDCRKSGGGLLAPLVWLLDKKDSGCKF